MPSDDPVLQRRIASRRAMLRPRLRLRDGKQAVIVKSLPADETIPADIVLPHEGISVMETA